jgi:phosphoserine phosphatase
MKKAALFDLDNTIYNGYSVVTLIESQILHGYFSIGEVFSLLNDMRKYRRGALDYDTAMTNGLIQWAKGLKGKNYNKVAEHAKRFYSNHKKNFFPYVSTLIPVLKQTHDVYFVTGEPQFVGEALVSLFDVNGFSSSVMEVKNDRFTGEITDILSHRSGKKIAAEKILSQYDKKGSFAFGDSEGDFEMLKLVENPICVNSSKELTRMGLQEKWLMVTPDDIERKIATLLVS